MKTRSRWTLVVLVLVVVACVGWFVVSSTFTTNLSYSASSGVLLHGDHNVEQIISAASATVHRLGYKTINTGYSFSSDDLSGRSLKDMSGRSLKAKHEDGFVVEINVDSKTDAPTRLRIRLTEKREVFSLNDANIGTALEVDAIVRLHERASRILKAITASLESP